MLWAISLNKTVKSNSNKPIDQSNFLWALKHKLSNLRGVPFDFNTQQDVVEILQVVLDELKCVSLPARQLTCFGSSENLDILTLAVSADIQASINQFWKPELLSSQNKWFCKQGSFWKHQRNLYINAAPILTIQLCRFPNQGGQLIKDANFFSWTQSEWNNHLLVPITVEDEVSLTIKDSLIATINHSGTLNRRHYWALIKDLHSYSWYSCNDELVSNVEERSLNNTVSYIIFYKKVWMFPRIYQKFEVFFARGFCHFRHCLWVWQLHI